MQDSYESELDKTRAQQEQELKRLEQSHSEELKNTRNEAREEVRKLKDELYDAQGRRAATIESSLRENEAKLEDAIEAQKNSHREELKPLLAELALYRNEGRDPEKERAQARQEEIESYEAGHIEEKRNIVDSYERTLKRLQNHEEELQDLYSRKLAEAELGNNAKSREAIGQIKAEFAAAMKAQRAERQRMEQAYQEELRAERSRSESQSRSLVSRSQEDTSRALKDKDQAYLAYLKSNAARVNSEMKARENVIRDLSTTTDARRVSPALVEKLRTSEALRYEDKLEKLRQSEHAQLGAIRERDHVERAAIRDRYEEMSRVQGREMIKESDAHRKGLAAAYAGMSELHESRVQDIESKTREMVGKLHQDQETSLIQQEKRNQLALQEQRDSLKDQKDQEVDDLKLESHLKDRAWVIKVNEQRRDFEKKLDLERDAHEREVAALKSDFQQKLHEQERTARRIVDEKDRNLEHQTKQQEMVHKEKERFLVEHYEEELDRMRRTNAHLIAKKS